MLGTWVGIHIQGAGLSFVLQGTVEGSEGGHQSIRSVLQNGEQRQRGEAQGGEIKKLELQK